MKKNNRGFFLAETIVVIALVTTVMAFLYPNVATLYDNYNNRVKFYDQTEDLYALRAVDEFISATGFYNTITSDGTSGGCFKYSNGNINEDINTTLIPTPQNGYAAVDIWSLLKGTKISNITELKELYFTGYMTTLSSNNYGFDRYLKRLKKTTYDNDAYRLIGVFEGTDEDGNTITRYASIKVDNPNPTRDCN